MKRLGLLGKNISHSKSQQMYEEILHEKIFYELFDIEKVEEIPPLSFFFEKIQGLSITAPYKKHFLSSVLLEEKIKKLGSINCIKKVGADYLASNSDYLAILDILGGLKINLQKSAVIILGDGAMSKVVQFSLQDLKLFEFTVLSRREHGPLEQLKLERKNKQLIVINTCAREFEFCGEVQRNTLFWDLNYHFLPHQYLSEKVSRYIDGLSLLKLQAEYALNFFNTL